MKLDSTGIGYEHSKENPVEKNIEKTKEIAELKESSKEGKGNKSEEMINRLEKGAKALAILTEIEKTEIAKTTPTERNNRRDTQKLSPDLLENFMGEHPKARNELKQPRSTDTRILNEQELPLESRKALKGIEDSKEAVLNRWFANKNRKAFKEVPKETAKLAQEPEVIARAKEIDLVEKQHMEELEIQKTKQKLELQKAQEAIRNTRDITREREIDRRKGVAELELQKVKETIEATRDINREREIDRQKTVAEKAAQTVEEPEKHKIEKTQNPIPETKESEIQLKPVLNWWQKTTQFMGKISDYAKNIFREPLTYGKDNFKLNPSSRVVIENGVTKDVPQIEFKIARVADLKKIGLVPGTENYNKLVSHYGNVFKDILSEVNGNKEISKEDVSHYENLINRVIQDIQKQVETDILTQKNFNLDEYLRDNARVVLKSRFFNPLKRN